MMHTMMPPRKNKSVFLKPDDVCRKSEVRMRPFVNLTNKRNVEATTADVIDYVLFEK